MGHCANPPDRPAWADMMTPGSLLLKFRQKFGHGPQVAYWRDIVCPKILQTSPVEGTTDALCEIHALTSRADVLNLIWALKSFYAVVDRRYALCIHEDGSLDEQTCSTLRQHFPDARLIRRAEADPVLDDLLQGHPRGRALRRESTICMKLFDFFHYARSDRLLYVDSDVLFYDPPEALIAHVEDPAYLLNIVNPDCATAYTAPREVFQRHVEFELLECFNSGLGLIHRDSLNWDWVEEFISIPEFFDGNPWRLEQTLIALCSSRWGAELLPEPYRVHLGKGIGGAPCRHYVGAVRHLMYSEGLRHLVTERSFLAPS